ncbi:uncharacterized protein LOC142530610 [Primulina tabacum]|uniref:uncharacterized protein LOC142530610 n=1 Tax=Primulina tabacum TaxID=48773 RepID=UPI003F5A7CC4
MTEAIDEEKITSIKEHIGTSENEKKICITNDRARPLSDNFHAQSNTFRCIWTMQPRNLSHDAHKIFNIKAGEFIFFTLQERLEIGIFISIELLTLCEALNPSDAIYSLIDKFYLNDFSKDDMKHLKTQLDHYMLDVFEDLGFKDVDSLPKLCRLLVETKKSRIYFIIDRLIRLILTLPDSTATTERAFSGMKLLKTPLHNKMEQKYLNNAMVLYIEREIAHDIDIDYIIDRFDLLKNRRLGLK